MLSSGVPLCSAGGPLLDDVCTKSCSQELAAPLKGEVRALLGGRGIDRFTVKPVRRSYAFENDAIAPGEQWVLKLRYSAARPSLPLGLEGAPPGALLLAAPCAPAWLVGV